MPPELKSYWQLMAARGRKVRFLQGCQLWETADAPADGPTPMYIQAALKGLRAFFFKEHMK